MIQFYTLTDLNLYFYFEENPMSIEQFLNKLPNSVVRNGKLINIRDDLSQTIKVNLKTNIIEIEISHIKKFVLKGSEKEEQTNFMKTPALDELIARF